MQMTGIFKNVLDKTRSKDDSSNNVDRGVPRAEEFRNFDFAANDP